jgi:hypothetical protein
MTKVKKRKKMPFTALWQKELTNELGEVGANELITQIQNKYHDLCANHKEISNGRLLKHLYGNIFPQMAAYKTFLEAGSSQESAFDKTQKLHFLTLDKQKRQYKILSRLPFCFPYMRLTVPLMVKLQHPPEGWNLEWVEKSKDCINLKAHTCFYNDIIKEYGLPELTLIYCNGDDYVFDVETPYIKWGRETAMTRGGDYCDIIYYRKYKKNRKKGNKEISD